MELCKQERTLPRPGDGETLALGGPPGDSVNCPLSDCWPQEGARPYRDAVAAMDSAWSRLGDSAAMLLGVACRLAAPIGGVRGGGTAPACDPAHRSSLRLAVNNRSSEAVFNGL